MLSFHSQNQYHWILWWLTRPFDKVAKDGHQKFVSRQITCLVVSVYYSVHHRAVKYLLVLVGMFNKMSRFHPSFKVLAQLGVVHFSVRVSQSFRRKDCSDPTHPPPNPFNNTTKTRPLRNTKMSFILVYGYLKALNYIKLSQLFQLKYNRSISFHEFHIF